MKEEALLEEVEGAYPRSWEVRVVWGDRQSPRLSSSMSSGAEEAALEEALAEEVAASLPPQAAAAGVMMGVAWGLMALPPPGVLEERCSAATASNLEVEAVARRLESLYDAEVKMSTTKAAADASGVGVSGERAATEDSFVGAPEAKASLEVAD